jgi:hypothetical protein
MERLLVFKEKMDANHENMLAKMASFERKIDARNAELDAQYEKVIAIEERTIARMDSGPPEMKDDRKVMKAD